ncbi:MAG: ABC transporter permease [Planctomycetota bacterium]|nr:ABC transporter permease [Planctomycetota bacterium]
MLNPLFFVKAVLLALEQIWINKTRSFLTALGIIIGVASVCAVIAALTGLQTKVLSEFESFGASKMFILHNRPVGEHRSNYPFSKIRMKIPELHAIANPEHCPSIEELTPITSLAATIQAGEETVSGVGVTGIWNAWHSIEDRDVILGRPFSQIDEDNARQVCLINDMAIEKLRLINDPTNSHILLNGRRFLIVGVIENKRDGMIQADFGAGGSEVEVYIPFATAAKMQSRRFFFMIMANLKDPDMSEEAIAEVSFVLRNLRDIGPDDPDTFQVQALDQLIDQFKALAAGITAIAGGIVGISLLVGGIGIMNIMLVSVSERTREIGLRKAVGATPSAVLLQFLLESVTLCLVGGFIGVAIGNAFAFGLTMIPDAGLEHAVIPTWAVVMSFAFSATVGVVFGMFPAIKASRLDPIEALRHE